MSYLPQLSVYHAPEDIITEDGLKIEVLSSSVTCQRHVSPGDLVTVHYVGTLSSGEIFDSSYGEDGKGEPIKFVVGNSLIRFAYLLKRLSFSGRALLPACGLFCRRHWNQSRMLKHRLSDSLQLNLKTVYY